MKKVLLIPRAFLDLLQIWFLDFSYKQKSSFTYTLFLLKWNKWVKPYYPVVTVKLRNHQLKVYNRESSQFLFKEIFLHRVYQFPKITIDKILDIGANIGFASIYFHCINPSVKIVAYEPDHDAFILLKNNVDFMNAFIQIKEAAVSNFNGQIFAEPSDETGSVNQKYSLTGKGALVRCDRLPDILKIEKFDAVKLDVEGAEQEILADCFKENLITNIKCWFIEFHDKEKVEYWIKKFIELKFQHTKNENVFCFWK